MKNPCYKCTESTGRHATCHVSCEKYIKFEKYRDEQRRIIHKNKADELRIREYMYDKADRLNKNKH